MRNRANLATSEQSSGPQPENVLSSRVNSSRIWKRVAALNPETRPWRCRRTLAFGGTPREAGQVSTWARDSSEMRLSRSR